MTEPRRIQLRRTKGWRMPPNTVKVDRSTDHGNPFRVERSGHEWVVLAPSGRVVSTHPTKTDALAGAVEAFREWITSGDLTAQRRRIKATEELRGKNLGCWCAEGDPCHGDVLLRLANPLSPAAGTIP